MESTIYACDRNATSDNSWHFCAPSMSDSPKEYEKDASGEAQNLKRMAEQNNKGLMLENPESRGTHYLSIHYSTVL